MIWLIGNHGMLGTDIEDRLQKEGWEYISSDKEIDITKIDELKNFIGKKRIDWIINCAAYTAVDKAEDEKEIAFAINAEGTKNIALIAREHHARLIHFSTDYVYSGDKDSAYNEDDPVGPESSYGKSKLEGENQIVNTLDEFFIIRISWLFGIHGTNFVYTMLKLMNERDQLRVVADQWGSPTFTVDVADLVARIVKTGSRSYGVYHFTNEGRINWHQFALEIYRMGREKSLIMKNVVITPITTGEYPTKATRPKNSYMSKDKVKAIFGISIRTWQEALAEFITAAALLKK